MSHHQPEANRYKVFISWSGEESKAYAKAFHDWFCAHVAKPPTIFFSERAIKGGTGWKEQVLDDLLQTKVIVAFLTKEAIHHSRWMEAEATAVRFCGDKTLVFPILIDLQDEKDIPEDSGWASLHGDLPFKNCQDFDYLFNTMKDIVTLVHPQWVKQRGYDIKLKKQVSGLLAKWEEVEKRFPKETAICPVSVVDVFDNDVEFAEWAYDYHRIIHHARDLTVHIQNSYKKIADPDAVLSKVFEIQKKEFEIEKKTKAPDEDEIKPECYPAMALFEKRIHTMLQILEDVFKRLARGSGAKVWICLRDLRCDGKYYNFLRTTGFPSEGREKYSVPWKKNCRAVRSILDTIHPKKQPAEPSDAPHMVENKASSGQNCTIITDYLQRNWPPSKPGWTDPHRKESILGAVLLKKVMKGREEPEQGIMWWVLCVNSNKRGVFTEAHQRLLQGCNDAFSAVANSLLRASHEQVLRELVNPPPKNPKPKK